MNERRSAKRLPLPTPVVVAWGFKGYCRSAVIRVLYAERCSLIEISLAIGVGIDEIRRTIHRPAKSWTNRERKGTVHE